MITERQGAILNLIVELFTQTHEPVGSKALQEAITSSSATIRNEMAKLEQWGFLEKAHTSSGRLPSRAGFQYFVQHSIDENQMDEEDLYQMIKAFDFEAFKLDDILQRAANLLAKMTGYTAVVQDVAPEQQRLTGFDIVTISQHDALAVLTLDESKPVSVQFAIPKNFLQKDLETLKLLVDERFVGSKVLEIHYKLRTEIPQVIQRYFTVTDNVLDLFDYIFAQLFKESIVIGGKVNALSYADLATYQFFDQDQALALALRSALADEQLTAVRVADHPEVALQQSSVISHRFVIPYRGLALLSLIGPVEMDYQRSVSLMTMMSRLLMMKLTDYYRYLNSNHYEVN